MGLVMSEDGDCSLIYGCEVDEEHVEAAAPIVCLLWCAFCCDWLTGGSQEWGGYSGVGVPLAKGVVDFSCCMGYWEVERVVV